VGPLLAAAIAQAGNEAVVSKPGNKLDDTGEVGETTSRRLQKK
jgi:hypothetical protein